MRQVCGCVEKPQNFQFVLLGKSKALISIEIFHKFLLEFDHYRDLAEQENPECLGLVWGLYGKLDIHPDVCQRLVLVRRCDRVGEVPGPRLRRHAIYRVGDVVLLPLVPPNLVPGDVPLSQQLGLKACPKHHGGV